MNRRGWTPGQLKQSVGFIYSLSLCGKNQRLGSFGASSLLLGSNHAAQMIRDGENVLVAAPRLPNAIWFDLASKTLPQIVHAHQHGAAWVERQVLKSPSHVEAADVLIERMSDDSHAADDFGRVQRRLKREQQQQKGHGVPLSLIGFVYRELT